METRVLWICFVWPEPTSSAAGVRTRQLIELSRSHWGSGAGELRVCSPCQSNQYQAQLESLGIKTARFEPNDQSFDRFIDDYQPNLVFFDRFQIEEQFSWRVNKYCPQAMRVLDTIDLHSLRRLRQGKFEKEGIASTLSDYELSSSDALREVAAIYRSDLALVVSDFERDLLVDRYNVPTGLVELCRPNYFKSKEILGFDQRANFVSIGNFNHPPNIDSVRLLQSVVWPNLRSKLAGAGLPFAELHVYGAYPNHEAHALDNKATGFRVMGWTPDVAATLARYRVNLAPLRFGAGIKGKICDGWSVGTPCVASSIAAEGMHQTLPFGGAIEDDLERFCDQALKLYQDRADWQQAQQFGMTLLETLYNEDRNSAKLIAAIEQVRVNIQARRARNIVGSMLWYHGNRSTEYFSRWIEAKNRTLAGEKLCGVADDFGAATKEQFLKQ